jgi:hypothetical protein
MHSENLYKNICCFTCGTLNDKMRMLIRTKAFEVRMSNQVLRRTSIVWREQHLACNLAISRWNTANVGFKPDKSHGAFSSRDLSALKPRFSFLFFSIEIQPFPNYRMTSIGHEPQLLILSLQFLSIGHTRKYLRFSCMARNGLLIYLNKASQESL